MAGPAHGNGVDRPHMGGGGLVLHSAQIDTRIWRRMWIVRCQDEKDAFSGRQGPRDGRLDGLSDQRAGRFGVRKDVVLGAREVVENLEIMDIRIFTLVRHTVNYQSMCQ